MSDKCLIITAEPFWLFMPKSHNVKAPERLFSSYGGAFRGRELYTKPDFLVSIELQKNGKESRNAKAARIPISCGRLERPPLSTA
jgi:hypothetical protein